MKISDKITVTTKVEGDIETVWNTWKDPDHIKKWNTASPDWHTTKAENDLKVGGKFSSRMEAKDGSIGFDFGGTYTKIILKEHIEYILDDGRNVQIDFEQKGNEILITEVFEPESQNPIKTQQLGWQSILDNFKKYVALNKI